jgi:hypothetical protein
MLKESNNSELNNNTTATGFLLNSMKRTKTLIDEANNYIQEMKKGEYFDKIINDKGRTTQHLLSLSPDETNISLTYTKCCTRTTNIPFERISSCEIGHANNFYSNKKFENFFTIFLTNNEYYQFYHKNGEITKRWVSGIDYLLQKRNKKLNSSKEIRLNKSGISTIWQTEIIPNWPTYRKYLHDKNKENYFTRKRKTNRNKISIEKDVDENIEILKSNHQEILNLWTFGLPPWLRKNLWNIVIGNELEITENLFQGYIKTIFREYINLQNSNNSGINRISKSTYCSSSLIAAEEIKNNVIKDINNDTEKCYQRYIEIIKSENKTNFKEDVFIIVRCFTSFRLDVLYSKQITELASFIYLNTDTYYDAFRILCNVIIPTYLFDFIQNDIEKIKNYCEFFEILVQKYVPLLFNYFKSINFSISNLYYKWTKNLFLKMFNYNICLMIFDNFLIRGKIFIFQVALAILIIKQKEIINSNFNELNLILKDNTLNIESDILLSEIEKLDIREQYKDYFDIYALGKEKIELFQDL